MDHITSKRFNFKLYLTLICMLGVILFGGYKYGIIADRVETIKDTTIKEIQASQAKDDIKTTEDNAKATVAAVVKRDKAIANIQQLHKKSSTKLAAKRQEIIEQAATENIPDSLKEEQLAEAAIKDYWGYYCTLFPSEENTECMHMGEL